MFRIKTDIRHYRCKNRDKVERLIRNWVIRPSDLIYDNEDDDWQPIGDHPAFVELFETLDEQHENQPETVVTDRVDDGPADADAVRRSPSDGGAKPNSRTSVVQSPPESPPNPSDDVVGVIRDSDEITVMTDRTLELMREEAPDSDDEPEPRQSDRIEVADDVSTTRTTDDDPETAAPDEPTARVERPEFDDGDAPETAAPDEPTARVERPEFDDDLDEDADEDQAPDADETPEPDEPTDRFERPDADDPPQDSAEPDEPTDQFERPDDEAADEAPEELDEDSDPDGEAGDRGRHDLPEDFFVTAEITEEEAEEETDDEDDAALLESRRRSRSQWNIILDEMESDAGDDDDNLAASETDDDDDEDLDPEPQPAASGQKDVAPTDDKVDGTDAGVEADAPGDDEDVSGDDEDVEEIATDAIEPLEVDEDELDEAFDDLEQSAIEARQADDSDESMPTIEPEAIDDSDSLGYEVDFPITVGPSAWSVKVGVEQTNRSKWSKNRRYSRPQPKTAGDIISRTYSIGETSLIDRILDRLPSPPVLGVIVGLIVVAILFSLLAFL